ncbi:MAG: exodeoxyribonuclease VII small subunit [Planctomycetota bacterium]
MSDHGDETAGGAEVGFEAAIARVEAIVERIESGEAGLEESIAEYEQGVALVKRCRAVLDRAEKRIQELTVDAPSSEVSGVDVAADASDEDVPF